MKPLRHFLPLLALFIALFATSCASSDVDPYAGQQTEADAGGHADDVWSDLNDANSTDSGADKTDTAAPADTGLSDTSLTDTAPSDAGPTDSGPSDTDPADTGQDAESTDTGRDADTGPDGGDADSGIECTTDNDCAGDAICHDREPVCVPSCCDNVTHQDSFTAVGYSHDRFDIAVTDAGEPAIVFVEGDTNTIQFAQPINGQWLSQEVGAVSNSMSTNVRLSLTSDGTPHVIMGRYDTLKHFWRDSSGWHSYDLAIDPDSVSYVDLAIDEQDNIHMVGLVGSEDVLYAKQTAQGVRSDEYLTLPPTPYGPVWTNIDTTSDGRPIASFHTGNDQDVIIAEKNAGSTWSYEVIGDDVYQVHGMAIDADDHPIVAYRKVTNDGLRLLQRRPHTWDDQLIVADPDHGYSPDIAVDSLGDPHVVYQASGPGDYNNPLYYARWNGADWEHHQLDSVDRAFYPRIALDASRTPHVVVFDPDNDAISYLEVQ